MAWVSGSIPRHVWLGWECFLHFRCAVSAQPPLDAAASFLRQQPPSSPGAHACCSCHSPASLQGTTALCQLWPGCAEHRGYQKSLSISSQSCDFSVRQLAVLQARGSPRSPEVWIPEDADKTGVNEAAGG